MRLIDRIRRRNVKDPSRDLLKSANVRVGSSQIGSGCSVRFDRERSDVALTIGDRCQLHNEFVFESVAGRISVGDGVFINGGTKVISLASIDIEDHVMIAWGCTIYDHDAHSISFLDRIADHEHQFVDFPTGDLMRTKDWTCVRSAPIRICKYVWLGFDVVVLKGVTIGEGAIIGARTVVTKDIPPWTIAAGNPGRVVKEIPPELRKR